MKTICYVFLAISILAITGCREDKPTEPPGPEEPTVRIISPQNNSSVYGSTFIEVEVTHDIKIAGVNVYIDGISDPGQTFEYEPGIYRYVWSVPQSADGRTYNIYATAEDEEGSIGRSEIVEVIAYKFTAPTELSIMHISQNEVQLNWNDNTEHEEGYIIERKKAGDFSELARVTADINSFNDNTLSVNANYKYRIKGYRESYFTKYTNEVEITYRQNIDISKVLEGHTGSVVTCDYSPDGSILATGSSDFTINLWNSADGTLINTLQGHENQINTIAFAPDGGKILSAGSGRNIKIWSAATGELLQSIRKQPHTDAVNGIAVSPDSEKFVTVGNDELVIIWDLETGKTIKVITFFVNDYSDQAQPLIDVEYTKDGELIAILRSGSQLWSMYDNIYVFNPDAVNLSYPQMASYGAPNITGFCYSYDGNYIMASAEDGNVYVWNTNLTTWRTAIEFNTHYLNKLYSADFSPDGNWIISGGSNGYIYLAKCAESKVVGVIEIDSGTVFSVRYSPDGTQAASCHQSGNVILWDVSMRWAEMD
jgi:WD40 repeat protein